MIDLSQKQLKVIGISFARLSNEEAGNVWWSTLCRVAVILHVFRQITGCYYVSANRYLFGARVTRPRNLFCSCINLKRFYYKYQVKVHSRSTPKLNSSSQLLDHVADKTSCLAVDGNIFIFFSRVRSKKRGTSKDVQFWEKRFSSESKLFSDLHNFGI